MNDDMVWRKARLQTGRPGGARLVSTSALAKGEVLWESNRYYIPVLYTNFTCTHCSSCFAELADTEKRWKCEACNAFLLCHKCNRKEARAWHDFECRLFCGVPKQMRQGDTDYLRFVCRYFSICSHGAPPACLPGSGLLKPTEELNEIFASRRRVKTKTAAQFLDCLATNSELQSEDFRTWCKNFSGLFKQYVPFPEGYSVNDLTDLLMRIRTNGLGFPCNDKHGTLGWSLDLYASFLDHSCLPNCEVVMAGNGNLVVRALRGVEEGGQLLISYVDIGTRTPKERKDHLYDLYRFHCNCIKCKGEI